jgi:hypothetical protein
VRHRLLEPWNEFLKQPVQVIFSIKLKGKQQVVVVKTKETGLYRMQPFHLNVSPTMILTPTFWQFLYFKSHDSKQLTPHQ